MSNVIHIDFLRAKRRKVLTLKAKRSTVEGPLAKERISRIAAALERAERTLKELKDEVNTGSSRK